MKKTLFITTLLLMLFLIKTAVAATLSLSPNSGSYPTDQVFTVNVLLDTEGQSIDGVDIYYLNYNPNQLEVQDDNDIQPGIQITAGSLIPLTQTNSVDNTTGKITFSQITAGGNTFKSDGAQILATIHFKVLKAENTTVSFDFKPEDTRDSNIASKGIDILTSATNAVYGSLPTTETNRSDTTMILIIFIILIVIVALFILLRGILKSLKKI